MDEYRQREARGGISMSALLKLQHIKMKFGGVVAVDDLALQVEEGEIIALIGPNGAGKTTVFNVITGVYKPTMGKCFSEEKQLTGLKTHQITRCGLARTFQNIRLFKNLTVLENILVAMHMHRKSNLVSMICHLPKAQAEEKADLKVAYELLELVGLVEVKEEKADNLPYGDQRRLEIARALATKPKLLLLDEPAAGMNPQETRELTLFIREMREKLKISVLMIEHHMDLVMEISDRIYVLDFGKLIAQGTPEEIQSNEKVIQAYLGVSDDAKA